MNSKTMSKILATVMVVLSTSAAQAADPKKTTTKAAPAKTATKAAAAKPTPTQTQSAPAATAAPVQQAAKESTVSASELERIEAAKQRDALLSKREELAATERKDAATKCDKLTEDRRKAMNNLLNSCTEDTKENLNLEIGERDSDEVKDKKKAKIKKAERECLEEFNSCQKVGDANLDMGTMMNSMGMSQMMPLFPDEGTAKKCSKYSQDKYDTKLEKLESLVDSKTKDANKLKEEAITSKEKAQEKFNEFQEKFIEAQEKKEEDDLKKLEEGRDADAAYTKQMQEYKMKISQIEGDITRLQRQSSLHLSQKGLETNLLKDAFLACRQEREKYLSEVREKSGLVRSMANVGSSSAAREKNCRQKAQIAHKMQLKKFNNDYEDLKQAISLKFAELQSIQESSQKLATMYQTAMREKEERKSKAEEAFLEKRKNNWLQMQQLAQNIQEKSAQTQMAIAQAETALNTANTNLMEFKGQEPLHDTKSLSQLREDYQNAKAIGGTIETVCKEAQELKDKYKNPSGQGSDKRVPSSSDKSTSAGGADGG